MGLLRWMIAVVVLVSSSLAHGDDAPYAKAREAVDGSQYAAARPLLDAALKSGTNGPAEVADIYRMQGIVAGALGDAAAATEAFERWLALVPAATLPAGTSPKIVKPFAAASDRAKAHKPLRVEVDASATSPWVTLVIENDPLELVKGARASVSADGKTAKELRGSGGAKDGKEIALALPKQGKHFVVELAAIDAYGNRLVELGDKDKPILVDRPEDKKPEAPPPPPPPQEHPARAWYARWWLWGTVAVAFAGGATYFGFQARADIDELRVIQANSVDHRFSDAQDVERRGKRDALLFNIGMGTAAAFAIGATILYLTDSPSREPGHTTPVAVTPVHGGAAIVYGASF